jgi:hypothetical protein
VLFHGLSPLGESIGVRVVNAFLQPASMVQTIPMRSIDFGTEKIDSDTKLH